MEKRMDMEAFAEYILAYVKEQADGAFEAWVSRNEKNNGVHLTGLALAQPGTPVIPCIYLEDHYKEYSAGTLTPEEAAADIYKKAVEHKDDLQNICVTDFWDWEQAKNALYPKLVNAEWNRRLLGNTPHRNFLDLAVVYDLRIPECGGVDDIGSVQIHGRLMESWGKSEEDLYQEAMKNMAARGDTAFQSMWDVIPGELPADEKPAGESLQIYILTNQERRFGAAKLLDVAALERIAGEVGNFVVLPSSLHEALIVPEGARRMGYAQLAEMVKEINSSMLLPEERLSDHVYTYRREEKVLKIAA